MSYAPWIVKDKCIFFMLNYSCVMPRVLSALYRKLVIHLHQRFFTNRMLNKCLWLWFCVNFEKETLQAVFKSSNQQKGWQFQKVDFPFINKLECHKATSSSELGKKGLAEGHISGMVEWKAIDSPSPNIHTHSATTHKQSVLLWKPPVPWENMNSNSWKPGGRFSC